MLIPADFKGTKRYRIVRRIGAGGMGVVYEAEDLEREQRVALKTIKARDSDALYRFKREFRALADLVHPNLVALHELVVDEACFFTMELVEGVDFLSHVRLPSDAEPVAHASTLGCAPPSASGGGEADLGDADTLRPAARVLACDEGRLRHALPQLVSGLMALHAAHQIHRDVKPANIMVTPAGRVVLLDFGLVMRSDTLDADSMAGSLVGTVPYMAPEQATGDRITPATDFYAVGTLLYEALTGRVPFRGSITQVLTDKQRHAPAPPRAVVRGVPDDLDDLCADLLKRTPEDRPTGPAVLRRLGADTADADESPGTTSSLGTRAAPFAGRELELARLLARFEGSGKRGSTVIQVRGASGIGKSTLIRRFLDEAHARRPDVVVLQGRCYERESVPYQAMDSLIDDLSHYWIQLSTGEGSALAPRDAALLPRLFPVLGRVPAVASAPRASDVVDPQEVRTRAFAALREVLQRVSLRRPLILVLDDLHWVDASTLTVLADLMRPPDPPRLLLVLTTRPEGGKGLDEVMQRMDALAETIDLEPLQESASARLAAELLGGKHDELARDVAREAGGNPFFIGELVRYVQSREHAKLPSLRLEDVIAQRIGQLSTAGRRMLQLVALAGKPITRRALESAIAGSAREFAEESGALRALNFIRIAGVRAGDRVETFHDRVRDAALASLTPDLETAHHRSLALAYEQWGEAAQEQLARHWQGAGEPMRAADHARKGAEEALARLDFDRASRLYRTCLELSDARGQSRRELFALLGAALSNAGRSLEAAHALTAAAEGAEQATQIELRRRSAEQLLRGGYVEEGVSAIGVVLAEFGLRLAKTPLRALLSGVLRRAWLQLRRRFWRRRSLSEIRARDLVELDVMHSVALGLSLADTTAAFEYQVRALLLALRLGEPERLARALGMEVVFLSGLGKERSARKALDLMTELLAGSENTYLLAIREFAAATIEQFRGAFRASYECLSRAERLLLKGAGGGFEIDTTQHWQSFALMYLGELRELSQRVPAHIREAERRGDRYASVSFRTRLNITWLSRDDLTMAEQDLESAIASWVPPHKAFLVQHYWALLGRCEIALYAGCPALGTARMAEALPGLRRSFLLHLPFLRAETLHLRGRLALAQAAVADGGTRGRFLGEVRAAARALGRERLPIAQGFSRLLSAGLARVEGRTADATSALREALRGFEEGGLMLYANATRRRLGETLEGPEGAALESQAQRWYAEQGVVNPGRMTAMLAPGWPHPDPAGRDVAGGLGPR